MRRVSILLVTTSVLVAGATSPALAKAQPVPAPDPNATAQQNPAQPAQNADAPADNTSIVVTGLRRSLQSARNIKRNSDQVVDAIVAEDIGKLPDITVSDTAARIPGVQVERNGGEATRVLIRGFDKCTTRQPITGASCSPPRLARWRCRTSRPGQSPRSRHSRPPPRTSSNPASPGLSTCGHAARSTSRASRSTARCGAFTPINRATTASTATC